MPVSECMRRISHREYKLWLAWLNSKWNEPSLTDYHLMQLSCQIANMFSKKVYGIEDFRIKFKTLTPQTPHVPTEEEKKRQLEANKKRWMSMVKMDQKKG
jgi:hypothetical protein